LDYVEVVRIYFMGFIAGNALQSDGIKRGSPPLRLENQPAMAGMDRMSGIKRI